jgi:hypothetical protein
VYGARCLYDGDGIIGRRRGLENFEITTVGEGNASAFGPYVSQEDAGLFGARTLGASRGGTAAGALVFLPAAGRLDILSLRVNPEYYFETCAVNLLKELLVIAKSSGAVTGISAFFTPASETERAAIQTAYEICGFRVERTGSLLYETSLAALREVPWIRESTETGDGAERLKFLSEADRYHNKALNAFLLDREGVYLDLPLENAGIIPEISVVSFDSKGEINGALLFAGEGDGIALAALALNGREAILSAMPMLSKALSAAVLLYSRETVLYIGAVTESSRALVNKLAGDAAVNVREGCRAELRWDIPMPDARTAGELVFDFLEGAETE